MSEGSTTSPSLRSGTPPFQGGEFDAEKTIRTGTQHLVVRS